MIHSSGSESSETSDEQKSTRRKSRLKHSKKNNTTKIKKRYILTQDIAQKSMRK